MRPRYGQHSSSWSGEADGRLTRPHDEITADYTDLISAATPQEIAAQGLRPEGRLRRRAVADSREEAASLPGSIPSNAGDRAANFHRFRTAHQRSSISQTPSPFDAGALAQHGLSRSDLLDRHRLPPLPRARR